MDTIIKDIDQIYLVIDSMTDLVRVVNEDGIVLLANKAMIEAVEDALEGSASAVSV